MKTINSPIRNIQHDDISRSSSDNQRVITAAKQVARKRDRARLNKWFTKEMTQYHCGVQAEKLEVAEAEREFAYQSLMSRIRQSNHVEAKRENRSQRAKRDTACDFFGIQDEVSRVEFSIERLNSAGRHETAVLASCG
jgi:hypothetical protein